MMPQVTRIDVRVTWQTLDRLVISVSVSVTWSGGVGHTFDNTDKKGSFREKGSKKL